MSDLLRRPLGDAGRIHDVTPQDAGWRYVGFTAYRLKPGDVITEKSARSMTRNTLTPNDHSTSPQPATKR